MAQIGMDQVMVESCKQVEALADLHWGSLEICSTDVRILMTIMRFVNDTDGTQMKSPPTRGASLASSRASYGKGGASL